jgi:diguanylate cyclase (GGDEF)-like protein
MADVAASTNLRGSAQQSPESPRGSAPPSPEGGSSGGEKDATTREAELIKLAYTDDLTGLFNRRYFSKYIKTPEYFAEGAAPLALCIMDLDYLKRINDRLGHLVGDRVLRRIGQLLKEGAGEGNLAVRYAGDEFAIICPGRSRAEAIEIADRLRLAIQNDPFEDAGLPDALHPSLSAGVAWFPEDAKLGEELVDRADKALYYSKRTGKNRVTSAADVEGQSEVADLDALAGFASKKVILGREDAFKAIDDAVALVQDGRNALVLVEGAPGIGKTRFLSELARYGRERELTCLLEQCKPAGREQAYRAIAGLLERYFRAEPSALAIVERALDEEKRRALGDIVPAFREYETTAVGAQAAAAIKAAGPNLGSPPATSPAQAPAVSTPASGRLSTQSPQGTKPRPPTARPSSVTPLPQPKPPAAPPPAPAPPAPGESPPAWQLTKPATAPAPLAPGESPPAWQLIGTPGGPTVVPLPTTPPASSPVPSGTSDRIPVAASAPRTGPPKPTLSKESMTPSLGTSRPEALRPESSRAEPRQAPGDPPTATVRYTTIGPDGKPTGPRPIPTPGSGSGSRPGPTIAPKPAAAAAKRSGERPAIPPRPAPPVTDPSPTRKHTLPAVQPEPAAGGDMFAASADEAVASASRSSKSVNVFMSVCQALAALSQVKPVLIMFDDMEHCDEPTLEVVARALPHDGRILFCGSARPESARPREEELESPYTAFHASLADFPNVFRVPLEPLDREKTAQLAQSLLQGFKLPLPILDRVATVSGGNPLFIEGVLRWFITTGVLAKSEDGFKVANEPPETIPLTLEDLVRGQLSILDKETAELLADAAVIGPNFDFEVLRSVGGKTRSEGEALDLVESARRARLLRDTGGGEGGDFEFESSVVADVTYKTLDEERKRTTHKKVAELKERAGRADASELAYHYRRAGEKEKAERFEAALRERSEQIFDRDAIEQLDDEVKQPRIPEVRDAPLPSLWKEIPALAKTMVAAARVSKPPPNLPKTQLEQAEKAFLEGRDAVLKVLGHCFDAVPAFTIAHRGNSLLLNGEHPHALHGEGPGAEALATVLRINSVKSITFLKSPAEDEIVNETTALLHELGSRTIQTPLERHFWWRFCIEKDCRRVSVVQKIPVLKKRKFDRRRKGAVRIAETDLPRVREFIWNLATTIDCCRKNAQGSGPVADALAALDRTLRFLLSQVPGLAINEMEGGLVINGTPLSTKTVGQGAPEVVDLLKTTKLRGFCLLSEISHQELFRFVDRIARLGPKDVEGDRDPGREISADGSFPNVLVGEAMFKMAVAALGPDGTPAEKGRGDDEASEKLAEQAAAQAAAEEETSDKTGLPPGFRWPTDALAKRAKDLVALEPDVLISQAKKEDVVEITEMMLLDGRDMIARKLWERCAIAFTSSVISTRRGAAELFQVLARRGTAELRGRFVRVAVRRLADALEIETDVDVFEQLVQAARHATLERIGDGDWDTAARLVFGISRRREASAGASQVLQKLAREALSEIVRDPRIERLFETLETGTVQDRRRAARVLEGMGTVAVQPLVDALKRTARGRVETFIIDLLAGLVPESELAIQREITPFAPPQSVIRLLRAASVVCRDPTSALVTALQNPDPQVRIEAVTIARSVGGSLAQAVLKWAVQHAPIEAQLAAVSGLGELARGDAVDSVLELLEQTETVEVQRECCLALGKMQTERAIPILTRLLRPGGLLRKEEHEDVRHASAWALGQMRQHDEARRALERALEDKNKNVRLAAKAFLEGRA